jgi:hypothetical protein
MILTHSERLQRENDLWIDCAGDEYAPGVDGVFSRTPFLGFSGGLVVFAAGGSSHVRSFYGSASGFLPQ